MAADETNKPNPEIHSDDDWKQRVKDQDAALDQKFQQEQRDEESQAQPEDSAGPTADEHRGGETRPSPEGGEPQTGSATASGSQPLPPPDFNTLVGMFSTQAMVALGVIPNPATGQSESQVDLARHFIDMLSVLENKTQGNLDSNEASMLSSTLHQLRMVYVEKTKQANAE